VPRRIILRKETRNSRVNTSEEREVTNKIWPDSVAQTIYEMTNFVRSHREAESPITKLEHFETIVITTNARLKSPTHRIFREGEGGRGKRDNQKEFRQTRRRRKMHRRSKTTTHLSLDRQAGGKVPMEKTIHGEEALEAMIRRDEGGRR
jgi:hypothetical protein